MTLLQESQISGASGSNNLHHLSIFQCIFCSLHCGLRLCSNNACAVGRRLLLIAPSSIAAASEISRRARSFNGCQFTIHSSNFPRPRHKSCCSCVHGGQGQLHLSFLNLGICTHGCEVDSHLRRSAVSNRRIARQQAARGCRWRCCGRRWRWSSRLRCRQCCQHLGLACLQRRQSLDDPRIVHALFGLIARHAALWLRAYIWLSACPVTNWLCTNVPAVLLVLLAFHLAHRFATLRFACSAVSLWAVVLWAHHSALWRSALHAAAVEVEALAPSGAYRLVALRSTDLVAFLLLACPCAPRSAILSRWWRIALPKLLCAPLFRSLGAFEVTVGA